MTFGRILDWRSSTTIIFVFSGSTEDNESKRKSWMLGKICCKENDVVSVKVNAEAFTLAQMRNNGIMQFFDMVRTENEWGGVDLNDVPSLFFIFVADKALSPIFVEKLSSDSVVRSLAPVPRRMLSAVIGNVGDYGANLVELTDSFSSYGANIIKQDLKPETDKDLLYRYEMAGVYGDPEKIGRRLERYFQTGINWDDSKSFIFKDLPLPPPSFHRDI